MGALPGYQANVYATTTPSIAFTNEATTTSNNITFAIINQAKRIWDLSQPLTIQTSPDGAAWTTINTSYTLNPTAGQVILASALSGATPSVRVSGYYSPYSVIGGAHTVELQTTVDILDTTSFGSAWKTQIASLLGASIKVSKWWMDHFFINTLGTSTQLVVSLYTGANANQRFDAFAYIKQDAIKIATNAVVSEDLEFIVNGQVYTILS